MYDTWCLADDVKHPVNHPSGHGIFWPLVSFQERDATDVMAAFHSDEAFDRLKTLPKVKGKVAVEPNNVTKKFRAFRKELVRTATTKCVLLFFPTISLARERLSDQARVGNSSVKGQDHETS